jgi:rhodanese-related sulfurtransferase
VLLDVRTEEEYLEGRLSGAVLMPDFEVRERAPLELPDKDVLILVYCRSGVRSARAAQELVDMGYTRVYDMGGALGWSFGKENDEVY